MLKRFVARLLIASQIYGNLFQGFAATTTEVEFRYPQHFRTKDLESSRLDESEQSDTSLAELPFTHLLYSEIDELGGLHLAWGRRVGSLQAHLNTPYNPADRFEYEDITVDPKKSYSFQGLRIVFNELGVMVVEGGLESLSKLFLGSNRPIIFKDIEASSLKIVAPKIVSRGVSTIDCLTLEGPKEGENKDTPKASFVNYGNLTAKQLFLNNLDAKNKEDILASPSTSTIISDELTLGEGSVLELTEDTRADIKTLFLSKASYLQNQQQAKNVLNIGVLHSVGSLGGSITNHGTMAIDEVAENSCFQAITNRHVMGLAQGDVKVETLSNFGAFGLDQGLLRVGNGTNSGVLKANGLGVADEFTNDKTGIVTVPLVSGAGELINLGKIETLEDLSLDVKNFSNSTGGSVNAKSITGLTHLQKFTNGERPALKLVKL